MNIRLIGKPVLCFSLTNLFSFEPSYDNPTKDTKTAQSTKVTLVQGESGWERLKEMFKKDEFGRLSPYLESALQTTFLSVFIGGAYGGFIHSKQAYMDFMRNNQATSFENHIEAKKVLQQKVTNGFIKGGFKWGWRLTSFTMTYVGVSNCVAVYRGKNGIIEHTLGGAAAGFVYKFMGGPRMWIVGSGLGLVLGTFGGLVTYSMLQMTGLTMEEVRYWSYKWKRDRDDQFMGNIGKQVEKDRNLGILLQHNEVIGKEGHTLEALDRTNAKSEA